MMYYTHLAFGLLSGLIFRQIVGGGNKYIFLGLVLVGALIPDLDHPDSKIGKKLGIVSKIIEKAFGHRGLMHTFYFAVILPGIIYYAAGASYGIAVFVGYMSHLFIDGFTKQGINFLHPVTRLHLGGFVETGGIMEKVVFGLIVVGIAIILL